MIAYVNILFPTAVLTSAVAAFREEFPNTPLRIAVEGMGAVIQPVLSEPLHWNLGAGIVTVFIGIWIATTQSRLKTVLQELRIKL